MDIDECNPQLSNFGTQTSGILEGRIPRPARRLPYIACRLARSKLLLDVD